MIKKYRRKHIYKAEQFDGSEEMIQKYRINVSNKWKGETRATEYKLSAEHIPLGSISNPLGEVHIGDWIIKGDNDYFMIFPDYIFKEDYEEVPE